jgi:hypothetical protein
VKGWEGCNQAKVMQRSFKETTWWSKGLRQVRHSVGFICVDECGG